ILFGESVQLLLCPRKSSQRAVPVCKEEGILVADGEASHRRSSRWVVANHRRPQLTFLPELLVDQARELVYLIVINHHAKYSVIGQEAAGLLEAVSDHAHPRRALISILVVDWPSIRVIWR